MRLSGRCSAPPEAVYDLLADLRAHLRWGGAEQAGNHRLLSLEAPDGPAAAGTVFVTTGAIPMSRRRWQDRSTVTSALRPLTFAFVTEATVGVRRRPLQARYLHSYVMTSCAGGSTVTYELTQERIVNPFLRLGVPVIRRITWQVAAPWFARRGLSNLLRDAESAVAVCPGPEPLTADPAAGGVQPSGEPRPDRGASASRHLEVNRHGR
ncbi:MAG: SRPBCC family protein [Candidatus Dormibacteria bacterium]|nr:hypothetical protein [Chloroflexota bacterium]